MIHTPPPDERRPRNLPLEREIMDLALRAAHREGDGGLSRVADDRAEPYGGLRRGVDWRREALQEIPDARNYLVWDTEDYWDAYQAGDPDAGERVAENLTALALLIQVWVGLARR